MWGWGFNLGWIHDVFIQNPLRSLYFKGPEAMGFWAGMDMADICSSLTTTSAAFWLQHHNECLDLCEKRFGAFSTTVNFVVYTIILIRVLNGIVFHVCFTRPVMSEIRMLLENKV